MNEFVELSFRTAGGARVNLGITGGHFGLEDQRVAGDDSFKAFSGLRHNYAALKPADVQDQFVTIRVDGALPSVPPAPALSPVKLRLDPAAAAGRLPRLELAQPQNHYGVFHEITRRPAAKNGIFLDVNLAPERSHRATALTWGWYPTINLGDDAIVMENARSILGQLRSARAFAPKARLRIDPISLDSIHPRDVPRDPRNDTPFAAAWMLAAIKYLSFGEADEAAFAVDGSDATALRMALAPAAGFVVRDVPQIPAFPKVIEAFALERPGCRRELWLANVSAAPQRLAIDSIASDPHVLQIAPYEVSRLPLS